MSAELELSTVELEATAGADVDELDGPDEDDGDLSAAERLPRRGRRRRHPPRH